MSFKYKDWGFAAAISNPETAREVLEESMPDLENAEITDKMVACINGCMAIIGHLGDGPFSVTVSGRGNKVYLSLQEVGKDAVL